MVLLYLGLWTSVLFLACVGYGRTFLRALAVSGSGWGLASGIGLSLLVFAGSLLNLAHAISSKSIVLLILPGAALFFFSLWKDRDLSAVTRLFHAIGSSRHKAVAASLLLFIGLMIAGRLAGQLRPAFVDLNDDREAYLGFSAKMIETGSYAPDPFSQRRITSSLGGYVFLSTLPLVAGDLRSLAFMDQGIGLLLVVTGIAGAAIAMQVGLIETLILLSCVVATPIYRHNATAALIGAGLVTTLLLALLSPLLGEALSYRRDIVAGLIMGALCTLKSTFIPAAVFIYAIAALLEIVRTRSLGLRFIATHATAIAVIVVSLVPWCIEMKRTSGTALYPLLGHGYDISAYNKLPAAPHGMTHYAVIRLIFAVIPLLIAAVWMLATFGLRTLSSRIVLAALVGSMFAAAFIAHSAFTSSFWRYTVPFALVSLWFAAALLLSRDEESSHPKAGLRRAVCAIAIMAVTLPLARGGGHDWSDLRYHGIKSYWSDLKSTLHNEPLLTTSQQSELSGIQSAVPPGAALLAHVENNFGFDYARNPVYFFDTPGAAGPPPGPPLGEGPEAWASYLTSHSIRYVAFGRAGAERGLQPGAFSDAEDEPNSPLYDPMAKIGGQIALQVDRNFLALCTTRRILFDDGRDVVIDLDEPAAGPKQL